MQKKLIVLDFDGTFTDVEKEGAAFTAGYKAVLAELLGRDIGALWAAEEEKTKDPNAGWAVGGAVVAPANCDPYIRCTCIASYVCERLCILPTLEVREMLLQPIYNYCYKKYTISAPRPEAARVLQALASNPNLEVRVVTNSETETVSQKIKALTPGVTVPVIGSAKKYSVVAGSVPGVPESQSVASAKRPLLLQRGNYHKILKELWAGNGIKPEHTLVCGDIFELDLALPMALGTRGHLLARDNAHAFERDALAFYGARGSSSADLDGLVDVVNAWG